MDASEERVELVRLLERLLKEAGCIDLEVLCGGSEVSQISCTHQIHYFLQSVVWAIRLDVRVLDHGGNLATAASAAALTALAHFRRPEVTLRGQEVTVHPVSERDPVPLAIHHYPVCSTFAFFATPAETPAASAASEEQKSEPKRPRHVVCSDPTHQEEAVMTGKLVVGANPHREICALHLAGNMLVDKVST